MPRCCLPWPLKPRRSESSPGSEQRRRGDGVLPGLAGQPNVQMLTTLHSGFIFWVRLTLSGWPQVRGAAKAAPSCFCLPSGASHMWVLYLDEIGDCGLHNPTDPGSSPIFGLGGIAIPVNQLRALAAAYHGLKRTLYRPELEALAKEATELTGDPPKGQEQRWRQRIKAAGFNDLPRGQWARVERYEVKGKTLASPTVLASPSAERRAIRFGQRVLGSLPPLGGHVFARTRLKRPPLAGHDSHAFYGRVAQELLGVFHRFLESRQSSGIVVVDERERSQNCMLLQSMQSRIFSAPLNSILETPFLVDSRWFVGVQIADNVAAIIHAMHRYAYGALTAYAPSDALYGDLVRAALWRDDPGRWTSINCDNR